MGCLRLVDMSDQWNRPSLTIWANCTNRHGVWQGPLDTVHARANDFAPTGPLDLYGMDASDSDGDGDGDMSSASPKTLTTMPGTGGQIYLLTGLKSLSSTTGVGALVQEMVPSSKRYIGTLPT